MLEKEIKILEIDKNQVEQILQKLGAVKNFTGFIHDIYYDFPQGSMDNNKRIFRVRKKGEIHLYTIKRKRNNLADGGEEGFKIADEGENIVTDIDSFQKVLKKYGMKKVREKKKHRISYHLGKICFDIDIYDNIPALLEIEAPTTKEISQYIEILGLQNHIKKDFGSRGLYKYYGLEYSFL